METLSLFLQGGGEGDTGMSDTSMDQANVSSDSTDAFLVEIEGICFNTLFIYVVWIDASMQLIIAHICAASNLNRSFH